MFQERKKMSENVCPITPKAEFERQVQILKSIKNIAVVGMSPDPMRPSNEVGMYLLKMGYKIFPVHPSAREINGIKVFSSVSQVIDAEFRDTTESIDLVDLFVAGDRTGPIVEEAFRLGIRRVWFQPGAENPKIEKWAKDHGMEVVSHSCTMAILQRGSPV